MAAKQKDSVRNWQNSTDLRNLLCELVGWGSETFSEGEQKFSLRLYDKLRGLSYFREKAANLQLWDVDFGRQVVSAFYDSGVTKDTVVLISHFDTVQTEEYGDFQHLATMPEQLTRFFEEHPTLLNKAAQEDIAKGEYLFGRGVMDMKMGLCLHMQLLEKAITEKWPINLMLVTVPDEEVNSAGMRIAVEHIAKMQRDSLLKVQLFLNSEPSFSQGPTDINEYIYSGTIGKIMPAALFYGKETHVGEPLKGMTAPYMSSFLTAEMEWNERFEESHLGETTPLPVSLQLKDLKDQYSTQTPYRAAALYNVFLMKRSASEIMDIFEDITHQAMTKCQLKYDALCQRKGVEGIGIIQTIRFDTLKKYAMKKLGAEKIQLIEDEVFSMNQLDDREKSFKLADQLMIHCQELAPAVVILFAPPFYPPANSSNHPLIKEIIAELLQAAAPYDIPLKQIHYFNGICDLSYCQFVLDEGWQAYEENTPVWGKTYRIPLKEIAEFDAPVLNVGPFGKDAHQISERLHTKSAFEEMPALVELVIRKVMTR
ncbi:MAG: M20/M25/M40 family metallo-hydrolase [Kurthia sp.]|nr:M20/M25/M40 family metallo-hydrolase [Candidatus Kurthia equi]